MCFKAQLVRRKGFSFKLSVHRQLTSVIYLQILPNRIALNFSMHYLHKEAIQSPCICTHTALPASVMLHLLTFVRVKEK